MLDLVGGGAFSWGWSCLDWLEVFAWLLGIRLGRWRCFFGYGYEGVTHVVEVSVAGGEGSVRSDARGLFIGEALHDVPRDDVLGVYL